MIKHLGISHFSGAQLLYVAFVFYANYQVLKWVFGAVKLIASSNFLTLLAYKLTPNSVLEKQRQKRIEAQKLKVIEEKYQKDKNHQEALEIHRKYEYTGWWNVGFIEEDRATLFKGYEDIKWQWGSHKIDRSKNYFPDESRHLSFMMFLEMAIYRSQFIEHKKWSPAMEDFWCKILPKQFVKKRDYLEELAQKASVEFESDKPTKVSA